MTIHSVIEVLDQLAPSSYQEGYDNTGLLTGDGKWTCTGALCTLDTTEEVIMEAVTHGCNLIICHHPIIFRGLKKITGKDYVEKVVIAAIKNDVAIYAIHTNLDNILSGVNGRMADKLGLVNRRVLLNKQNNLMKLVTFVPKDAVEKVRAAMFAGGGGKIGNYSECSFNIQGTGTFKPEEGSDPFVGQIGKRHEEEEMKIETIFPAYLHKSIVTKMIEAHPYEEVAYDVIALSNYFKEVGSGLIGEPEKPLSENDFLALLKETFQLKVIRHTALLNKPIKKVAVCGGTGSFLTKDAIAAGADIFITADVKYHEFFDCNSKIVIADIGHFESEQYTTDLLFDVLKAKFPTFALLKTKVKTNPVQYYY